MGEDAGESGELVQQIRGATYCEDCIHLYIPDQKSPSWRWLCAAAPRGDGPTGFVTRKRYDTDPPFHYCNNINKMGNCYFFEAGRNKINQENE